jgi:hypothetical protein
MLTLTGIIRAAVVIGGGTDKLTKEVRPTRPVLQIEGLDNRGLVSVFTLTVPDLAPYSSRIGEQISVPVRAWAKGTAVNLSYEAVQ